MNDLYNETDDDVVRTWRRVHANGEQTHVAILSVSKRDYAAVAYDLAPGDFEAIDAAAIGYDPTIEGVIERAERWLDAHPKGVAYEGDSGGDDGGRDWGKLFMNMLKKLNEYGNQQRDQMQQNQGGKQ